MYGMRTQIVELRQGNSRLETNIAISKSTIKFYKDKYGQEVAQKGVMILKTTELNSQAELLGIDNKRLKNQVGKLDNLVSYWKVKAGTSGRIDTVYQDSIVYINGESVLQKKLGWSNKYLTLNQTYFPATNKLTIDYSYSTGIELTIYDKSKGWFKKPELVGDVRFDDPDMKATKSDITIIDKTKQPKFYQTTLFKIGVGVVGGFLLTR